MRTTITIDDDVLEHARAIANRSRTPFKTVVNKALRAGLGQVEQASVQNFYQTKPHAMGIRQGYNIDSVQKLLARIEGEDTR